MIRSFNIKKALATWLTITIAYDIMAIFIYILSKIPVRAIGKIDSRKLKEV